MDIETLKLEIDTHIAVLNTILTNFNKAPNRNYNKSFLTNKKHQAFQTLNHLSNLLRQYENKFTSAELTFYIKGARQKYDNIILIINHKLVYAKESTLCVKTIALAFIFFIKLKRRHYRNVIMASLKDMIMTASQTVPEYDGTGGKLNKVLSALSALALLETDVNRAGAIAVIQSKLDGRARAAVGQNPASIQAIIDALKDNCKEEQPPEVALAKLNATKQTKDLNSFTDQVEKLALDLEKSYLSEQIPAAAASKLATKAAVKALAAGVKCKESSLILKASNFATLNEAIQKVTENEPQQNANEPTSANVFYSRGHPRDGRGRQNRRRFINGNTGRQFQGNRSGNFQQNRQNFQQNRRSFRNWRGSPGNFQRYGNQRGGFQQRNMYLAQEMTPGQPHLQQAHHAQMPQMQQHYQTPPQMPQQSANHPFLGVPLGQLMQ